MNIQALVWLLYLFAGLQILSVLNTQTSGGFTFVNMKLLPFLSSLLMLWAAIIIQSTIH